MNPITPDALIAFILEQEKANAATADLGGEYLSGLEKDLQIDSNWRTRLPGVLCWWAFGTPIEFTVSEPRGFMSDATVKVTASIRVVEDCLVQEPARNLALTIANAHAAGEMVVFDPDDRSVSIVSTFYVHEGNRSVVETRIPLTFNLLQVGRAMAVGDQLAVLFRGHAYRPEHPGSGARIDSDELAHYTNYVVVNQERVPDVWSGEFASVAAGFVSRGLLSTAGRGGLSVEFPFRNDIPEGTATIGSVTSDTTLCTAVFTRHPTLGEGLLVLHLLPIEVNEEEAAVLANGLNRAEALEFTGFPSWGAWTVDPDLGRIAHSQFHPRILARAGMLTNLLGYEQLRAEWVRGRLTA